MIIISAAGQIAGPSVTSYLQMVVDRQEQTALNGTRDFFKYFGLLHTALHGTYTEGEFIIHNFNDYCIKSKEKERKRLL